LLQIGKRNIQQIGRALYVNLPKVWTENTHIKKGDVVDIELKNDGSLNIKVAPTNAAKQPAGAATTSEGQAEACHQ